MVIDLYKVDEPNNKLIKTLDNSTKTVVNGNIKGAVNIIAPLITVTTNILDKNYCYIEDFHRYYFIEDITINRTNLYDIKLKLDVLMTYHEELLECDILTSQSTHNKFMSGYAQSKDSRYDYEYINMENNFNEKGNIILIALNGKRGEF